MLELFAPITTFVFDVDGTLTDGGLTVAEDTHGLRTLNSKDGYAFETAISKGYNIWIISGGRTDAGRTRFRDLGVTEVHTGVKNKKECLHQLSAALSVPFSKMLYMGDDIVDYAAMQLCALPTCPQDAVPEIKQVSKYISPFPGGRGCARDVIEKVLKLNGHWILPE